MLARKNSIDNKRPFAQDDLFDSLESDVATKLAMVAGDITLVLNTQGEVLDASADPNDYPGFEDWIGSDLLELVTIESRPKIMELLAAARKGEVQHWRQVNHPMPDGDIPVRYVIVASSDRKQFFALGRDMREAAVLQQRLLQAQQTLERDYARLRHVETRYRILFEQSSEPVLIVEHGEHRIREANRAAHAVLGAEQGSLPGTRLTGHFARNDREPLISYFGSALAARKVKPFEATLARNSESIGLSATGFRENGRQFLLVRLSGPETTLAGGYAGARSVLEEMPDAFVMANSERAIVAANMAFVELVGAASLEQILGHPVSDYIGRPGIDMELIEGQLAKNGTARNVMTVIGAAQQEKTEPVELSAVRTSGDSGLFGFVIRAVGRRLRDLPPMSDDLPRSVEQLTELVGRMSLKDIVRESTDLIERLCIEAALSYTSNNRASAAEILGLSRQSLYSKLNRYGFNKASNA